MPSRCSFGVDFRAIRYVLAGRNVRRRLQRSRSRVRIDRAVMELLEVRQLLSVVSNTNDTGAGSLRDAIATTAAGGNITFQSGLSGTIHLSTALDITQDLTISGLGATVSISGDLHTNDLIVDYGVTASVSYLTITNGQAAQGAGVFNSGNLTLDHDVISNNGSAATTLGGAVFNKNILKISNSTISGNTAVEGGGVYNYNTLYVNDSTMSGNTGVLYGGAIFNPGNVYLTDSAISSNKAGSGGGIQNTGGLNITGGSLSGNTATDPVGTGGAINGYGTLYSSGAAFSSNTASTGGAIDSTGTVIVIGGSFSGDTASNGVGGSVYAGGTAKLYGATFTNETATGGGGSVADFGNVTIIGSTFTSDSAGGQGGGAIFNNGDLVLNSSSINNSKATGTASGGGVMNLGTIFSTASTFSGDTAAGGMGGAVYNYGKNGNFGVAYLTSASITGCSALAGGGIFNKASVSLTNGSVTGNAATAGNGGGIDNQATLTANGTNISNDTANAGNGGAIANTGYLNVPGTSTLNDVTISNSSAVNGGAIFNQNNVLTISASTLFGDTATNDGGCIDNQSNLFAANATFTLNSAGVQGGAIFNNSSAKMVNCTIDGNSAGSGGGISTSGAGSNATLYNTIISQNTSGASASDILGTLGAGSSNNLVGTGGAGGLVQGVNGNIVGVSNPLLSPLQNNGGPDFTMAPLPGSVAIDAGNTALALDSDGNPLVYDQRGIAGTPAAGGTPRVVGSHVDIGAVEIGGYTLSPAAGTNPQSTPINHAFNNPLTVNITSVNGLDPVNGGVITFMQPVAGASASLIAQTADVTGGAQSDTAVANNQIGTYFVNATVAGAVNTTQFQLTNLNLANPTINTTPGGTIVIGSGSKLTDSATISGGVSPSGSLIFTLYSPGNAVVDTETVTISGNGTYNTPSGYLPVATGTYQWAVAYNGDSNNNPANSPVGNEPESVTAATPTLTTTASETAGGAVGSAMLSDSVTVAGGFNPSGTITFTLTAPDSTTTTETLTVSGDGTYSAPTPVLATQVGVYHWSASYGGDASNHAAVDQGGAAETSTTVKASPTLTTTASATGAGVVGVALLSDSVTVAGGDNPTGTITFILTAPDSTTTTETVSVSGDGTYSIPTPVLATQVGTYVWTASYAGNTLNNTAHDQGGAAETSTTVKASPTITTTASETAGGVVGSANLSDSVTVAGGDSPAGTITFTLTAPDSTTTTETLSFSGDGVYSAPTPVLATQVGTYTWTAVYGGNALNNGANDQGGAAEQSTTIKASPTITTTASETAGGVVGSAQLSDSVTVAGGDSPSGVITFVLTAPDSTTTTETLSFSGDGIYSAPTPVLATQVGTYVWTASYAGNTLNNTAHDQGGAAETSTTVKASPTITTTASETAGGVVGSANLSDSVTVTGGFNPTGNITFILTAPDSTTTTETVSISGDGTYSIPTPVLATQVGTYVWTASYAGNTLNNTAHDQGGSAETNTTVKASPTITTTASASAGGVVGSSQLSDSVTVAGGDSPSGTITFTLIAPDSTTTTETLSFTGDGVYSAPTPVWATQVGTYTWTAVYGGNALNNGANDQGGAAEQSTTIKASPTITTTASETAGGVVGSAQLSDSVTVAGGDSPSGVITFVLTAPDSTTTTETVSISGDGTYSIPTPVLATQVGTYVWTASYAGNTLNNTAHDQGGAAETSTTVKASPTITTTASETSGGVVGSANLSDSVTVAGGDSPAGTITFTLTAPDSTTTTETLSFSGDGTYSVPTPVLATQVGTYTWTAVYGGNALNNGANDQGGSAEQSTSVKASPTITTTASETAGGVVGSANLSDSVTVTGGDSPSGVITFVLTAPDSTTTTETLSFTGDGVYSALTPVLATQVGTYVWTASYAGNTLNNTAHDQGGAAETSTTVKASPTITTTASETAGGVVGSAQLSDSVTVAGGDSPSGIITFILTAPDSTTTTETVSISGDGTYSIPTPVLATQVGTYVWTASYAGNTLNNTAHDQGGAAETSTTVKASPTITTTASETAGGVVGSAQLSDSVTVAGGFNPTGNITFILTAPDSTTTTETVSISGDGTYSIPTPVLATQVGTYVWTASYAGNTLNNTAHDQGGAAETSATVKATASISTTPGGAVVVGSGAKLTDSAMISGGYNDSGTVVFTLYSPTNTVVDTETVAVSGNGTYSTPSGYVPAVTGTYQWGVVYSGDVNNTGAVSSVGNEPEVVSAASPAIYTTPSAPAITLGTTPPTLADSATLSGGFDETGSIVFTLVNPNNVVVDTETVSVNGDGSYTTPSGYVLPTTGTLTGVYQWNATYNGDANNVAVSEVGSTNERTTISAASPSLGTIPGGSIVIGSGAKLTDSATLTGGYFETGSLVFTLYSPSNTVVDTETVTVNGNGTYNTPSGYVPTVTAGTGTYQWGVVYNGDSNNNTSTSAFGSEPETVTSASPTIVTTPSAPHVTLGTTSPTLTDTAVLSGGFGASGSITFTLMGPGNTTVDIETVTVSGNGSYSTPSGYILPGAGPVTGLYQWNAAYSGDANNSAVSENGQTSEQTVVSSASPTINTTPGGSVVIGSGNSLTDSATLSGGYFDSGTLVFTLYSPSNTAVDTETVSVLGNGTYSTPNGFVPTVASGAGTYQWGVVYSGDANNNGATSPVGSEPEAVTKAASSISTTPGGAVVVGSGLKLNDSATISGAVGATGTLVFTLYSPGNVVVDTETVSVSGNGTYNTPSGYVPTGTGTYQWGVVYSGDANNSGATSAVGSEPESVTKASTAITTTPGGSIVVGSGSKLTDSATISGGYNDTGTIVFTLYSPSNTVVDTETVTVSGNGTYGTPSGYVPTGTGTYQWGAVYSGDTNNIGATSPVGSEPETVTSASPTISTTPGGSVIANSGAKLHDSATISGGFNDSGTIVFTLYSPTNTVVDTETVTVSGNGTYSTPSGFAPTSVGTYQWGVVYSGDTNNNGATSLVGSEPEVATVGAASQLVFIQQPTSTTTNTVISPAVTVAVEDQYGNIITSDNSSVSVAINSGPGGAVLSGTQTIAANAGVATFSTLSLNTAGTYTLAATDSSLAPAISNSFKIVSVGGNPNVDLALTKTVNNATPNVGTQITYTVTVQNITGYSTATNVSVADALPAGESLVTATPSVGTYSGGVWSIPALASGGTATLTYTVTVNAFAPQTNTATVTHTDQTDVGTQLSQSVTVNPQEVDLSITKTVNNSTPNVGTNVTYTVTVSNAGGYSTASHINVSDLLPSGESLVSSTPSSGTYSGGVWSISTLAAGASATLTVVASVNTFAPQTNTATITAVDQTEAGTTLSASNTINPQEIDLSLTKTVNSTTPNVGTNVTYTVTVNNATGYSAASSINVADSLPAGESLVSATPSVGTYSGGVWSIPTLAAGATATLTYVAKVNAFAPQTNTATVTSAAQTDIGTQLSQSVTVNPQEVNLSVTKTVNNSTPNVGANVTYTVTVSNATGFSTATSINVADSLPSGESLVSATPSVGTYSGGVWSIPTLGAGASATLVYVAKVNAFAPQTNTATITSAAQTEAGTQLSASVTVTPQEIDLSVTKTVNSTTPNVGDNVTYTVTVSNATGYSTATSVSVTDLLPSGESLVSATPSSGTYSGGVWSIPTLAAGASATLTYVAKVNVFAPQTNTATITSAAQTEIGTQLSASVTVNPQEIDLSVTKTVVDATQNCSMSCNMGSSSCQSGNYLWFNCVMSPVLASGCNSVTYNFTNCQITFTSNGQNYCVNAPNACVTYSRSCTQATTTFNSATNCWVTTAPCSGTSGNTFLNGCAYQIPSGGLSNITNAKWSGCLTSNVANCNANWQWAATSYNSNFCTNYNNLNVKPCDDYSASCYHNGDNAGTPEACKGNDSNGHPYLCGGGSDAGGGYGYGCGGGNYGGYCGGGGCGGGYGGSCYTGSYSCQQSCFNLCTPSSMVMVGDTVQYTVTVSNGTGFSTATHVMLTDLLPSGETFIAATPSQGTYNPTTGIWSVGTVAAGGSATLIYTAKITTSSPVTNTATITGADQTKDVGSPLSASVTVNPMSPGSISGYIYVDINDSGTRNTGDLGLGGQTVTLTGTPTGGSQITLTTTTASDGSYSFTNLLPGTYQVSKVTPCGYTDAATNVGTVNSVTDGTLSNPDLITSVVLASGGNGINYNFGEFKTGSALVCGEAATIGFWHNNNGQALIKGVNGSASSTLLGNWLAATFHNLYANLAGNTNTQVAAYYMTLFNQTGTKTGAQIMSAALSVYVTTSSLAGSNIASGYGFQVSTYGSGSNTYNVGSMLTPYGGPSGSQDIIVLLNFANSSSSNGNIANGNVSLQNILNTIFSGINQTGDIS